MGKVWFMILALLASAFFSAIENAFLASNKLRLELDKKQGLFYARIINFFQNHAGQFFVTVLLGNTLANVIFGICTARALEPALSTLFQSTTGILATETLIAAVLLIALAELLPKYMARIDPNIVLRIFSLPVLLVYGVFYPAGRALQWVTQLSHGIGKDPESQAFYDKLVFGRKDLDHLLQESQEGDNESLNEEKDGIRLFQNVLDFSNVKVRDCMIPRTEIIAAEIGTPVEELRQLFIRSGFSKILIYEENIDTIIGYVTSKDLFKNPVSIRSLLITLPYVPETMPANKLFRKFIQEHKSIAVVVDEFGGISGMLTIEDIMEEIFGEIDDEHDVDEFIEKKLGDGYYVFSGRLEIDYLNETYDLSLPETEEYVTLAGCVIYHHGSIPKQNDVIRIGNYEIKILKVSLTRVELVQLKTLDERIPSGNR